MMELLLIVSSVVSACLIVYSHVGYPMLLSWYKNNRPLKPVSVVSRRFKKSARDAGLPSVTLIVPAYNEAQWIQGKIRNIASLDYPRQKLNIIIACDGCTDKTAQLAQLAIQEAICEDVHFEVINFATNRGKIAIINKLVPQVTSDIVALSDVSALLSIDSLQIASQSFKNKRVGVVNPNYCMTFSDSHSETSYWKYQAQIKNGEACLGATIGCHGAFYLFRQSLFQPLDLDTINDDFVLPMKIVEQGYSIVFEPRINAIELEQTNHKDDFARRLRISAGNMQQVFRLIHLFNPKYASTAFTFFSGKGLRLLTPYLMLLCLICSLLLIEHPLFLFALVIQITAYSVGLICCCLPFLRKSKVLSVLTYLLSGHLANLVGGITYLFTSNLSPNKIPHREPSHQAHAKKRHFNF